jgi:hypothetical protein
MPPLRPKSLTQQKSDFTAEGAPPPESVRNDSGVETPGRDNHTQTVVSSPAT